MSMEPSDPFSNDIADRYCRHIRAKERKSPSICLHTNDVNYIITEHFLQYSAHFSYFILIFRL